MPVDYKKDKEENKEFDEAVDSVSPEGKYQKPPLENLRKGVKIRNRTGTAEELGFDSGVALPDPTFRNLMMMGAGNVGKILNLTERAVRGVSDYYKPASQRTVNVKPVGVSDIVDEVFNYSGSQLRKIKQGLGKYDPNVFISKPEAQSFLSNVFASGDKPTPPSDNPLYKKGQKRNEQAKTTKGVIYPIVKDFGGSEVQAKQIWEKVNKQFKDVQKATSQLNELYRKWEPNSKIDIIENKDGTVTLGIVPRHNIALPGEKPRYKASWQFEKDHIRAVMNQFGESGGMNMAENMEIIFGKINREKSNLYQLPEEILSELAVPKNITEYIFNELHPEYQSLQSKIPQRFKESFTKNILNDYYEQIYGTTVYRRGIKPRVGQKKWPSIMRNITQKYARLYKDDKFLTGLTILDDQPFWERAGDEIPQWAQLLKMPRSKRDPFWMQLNPKAQKRWIRMVEEKKKSLQTPLPVEGGLRRTMSKEKFYRTLDDILPND